ncbi:MAG: SDR family oxidoreductase [Gammaproteobacteria bacterium]|nr:SDR family oxidoreductase [Gammaproteobacteria bacterium]
MSELILGCGHLGRLVAAERLDRGHQVLGVIRTASSSEQLRELGISATQLDLDTSGPSKLPLENSTLFYFVPPPRTGDLDTRIQRLISEFSHQGNPHRVVYLSTTGVYGDCKGAWISEEQPVNPVVARAKRRWDAECRFREWSSATGGELVILRVAGIYGPGKLPLERLRKGLPLVRAKESPWTNRIHISDLVQVCIAAMDQGRNGEVYNASDGSPGTMIDYFTQIAELSGLPPPQAISLAQAQEQLSAGMLSYMRESRRLDNSKIRSDLGITLEYPTLEQGLPACLST